MKLLETIFFYLTIIVPSFFLIVMVLNISKVMKKKKFRYNLIKCILLSLIINGMIFGGIRILNNDKEGSTAEESQSNMSGSNESNNKPINSNDKLVNNTNSNNIASKTSKGYSIEVRDGVTYIDGYMLVNKTYALPENYVPSNTYKSISNPNGACAECLIKDAYTAYTKLHSDASSKGLNLWIASGFRSYSYQAGLYNSYVKRSGKEKADTYSARPGHSEHQTGYAFDINTVDDSFANTNEGKWINENCYKYGFIIRYPKGKDNETGYKYEPWHLRYVGEDLATKLYNGGDWITMEDYFGITSQYAN